MRFIATFAAFGIAVAAHAQAKMLVYVNGQKAGTATVAQRITDAGGKIVQLGMIIKGGERVITVRSESTYDAKGVPIRKFQETLISGKERGRREVIVTFDGDGANVVLINNGERSTKHVSLLSTAPREDASEFWFMRDRPAVGAVVTSYRFNLDTLAWDLVRTTFKGQRPVTIAGHRTMSFVTDSEQGTAFLDQDGLPLRLELPDAAMERVWEN